MKNNQHFNQIEILFSKLLQLLVDFFTESEMKEVQEFIDVGEYGVALETLCSIIDEENKVISKEVYDLIAQLGTSMEMGTESWEFIRDRQKRN